MKRYIKMSNTGEIENNAFKLIGASSKRNDKTKIGFFGSGLKYGMAFLLREKIDFYIFSGEDKVEVTTRPVSHREQEFNVIQVNGEDTSMTTEMGPKWTHWGAVREIYCNAVDEGEEKITIVDETEVVAEAGRTIFYVELTSELTKIVDNWDNYFSKDRKDIVYKHEFGNRAGTIFWSKPGVDTNDFVIYRKGIQCHMSPRKPSCFHYDFPWIEINESREIDSMYNFENRLVKFFAEEADSDTLQILLSKMDAGVAKFEFELSWSHIYNNINVRTWTEACKGKTLVPAEIAGWYAEIIERKGRENYWMLPGDMVARIRRLAKDINVMGENMDGYQFCKIEPTDKQAFLLKEVMGFFEESGHPAADYTVEIVMFDDSSIDGHAKDNTLYISDHVFNSGRKKIAEVIYFQCEQLRTSYGRNSMEMKSHLVRQVISHMEEKHAFFL